MDAPVYGFNGIRYPERHGADIRRDGRGSPIRRTRDWCRAGGNRQFPRYAVRPEHDRHREHEPCSPRPRSHAVWAGDEHRHRKNNQAGVVNPSPSSSAAGNLPSSAANSVSAFSLAQTIEAALESSDLQIAQRNVEIDRRRADEAAAAARPNIAANGEATRFDQATKISIGGGPPIEVVPIHTEVLSIHLADRLDITGQIRAASDQARLQSFADQFQLDYIRPENTSSRDSSSLICFGLSIRCRSLLLL